MVGGTGSLRTNVLWVLKGKRARLVTRIKGRGPRDDAHDDRPISPKGDKVSEDGGKGG